MLDLVQAIQAAKLDGIVGVGPDYWVSITVNQRPRLINERIDTDPERFY